MVQCGEREGQGQEPHVLVLTNCELYSDSGYSNLAIWFLCVAFWLLEGPGKEMLLQGGNFRQP